MYKSLQYLYVGENGSILSPVKLIDVYSIKKYKLVAETNYKITKDNVNFYDSIIIPESELDLWYEVEQIGQK